MKKKEKRRKTFELRLTKIELLHLRDLMSILSPPDLKTTVSQLLAESESRSLVETMLWKKIAASCEAAKLPLGDEAPDFVVAPTAAPPIGVFRMATDPAGEEAAESAGFLPSNSDEDEDEDEEE